MTFCLIELTSTVDTQNRWELAVFVEWRMNLLTARLHSAPLRMAEAEAFRDGIRIIPEGTREHIIVESDCLELVSLWKDKENTV